MRDLRSSDGHPVPAYLLDRAAESKSPAVPKDRRAGRSENLLHGVGNRPHLPAEYPHRDAPAGRELAGPSEDLAVLLQEAVEAVAELTCEDLPRQEMKRAQDVEPTEKPGPLGRDGGRRQMGEVDEFQDAVLSLRRDARRDRK